MTRFIQLHALTVMPPSNPNRDDQGKPKTTSYGGFQRLRWSSQSMKRALRMSSAMQGALEGHLGSRTQRLGEAVIEPHLIGLGASEEQARKIATDIMSAFGKTYAAAKAEKDEGSKKRRPAKGKAKDEEEDEIDDLAPEDDVEVDVVGSRTRQLVFVSPEESRKAVSLAERIYSGKYKLPEGQSRKGELQQLLLQEADAAVDIAMFGRMLADAPAFSREAAVQVSHAMTTHRAIVEDDFYVAVDDLRSAGSSGSSFLDDAGFGSGVYYTYVSIDIDQLERNLGEGNGDLARKAVLALVRALSETTPTGKIASFANHVRASHIRVEYGSQQPRTLSAAFLKPVRGEDMAEASVSALEGLVAQLDHSYGPTADEVAIMDVQSGRGSLQEILGFVERVMG